MDGLALIEGDGMYHYTACGLDYVWLCDGFEYRETPHGRAVRIHDIDGLHAAIARWIISAPRRLQGQDVRFLRSMLHQSQEELARVLGQTRVSVARWEGERTKPIPGSPDHALRLYYPTKVQERELASRIADLLPSLRKDRNELAHARFVDEGGEWKAAA